MGASRKMTQASRICCEAGNLGYWGFIPTMTAPGVPQAAFSPV